MAHLSIFANFLIDNDERLQRMKDSCLSFLAADTSEWVVHVRGKRSVEAREFLAMHLGSRLICRDWGPGADWSRDSESMLPHLKGDYVLFWLEDHICVAAPTVLNDTVDEMKESGCEYLMYTFWWNGGLHARYRGMPFTTGSTIDWFDFTAELNPVVQSNAPEGVFIIAACSIFSRALFERLILTRDPAGNRWPIDTPFNFEKGPHAVDWLPLRVAVPRQEIFASIDDDHVHPGTSLISRGLYPNRSGRRSYATGSEKVESGSRRWRFFHLQERIRSVFVFRPGKKKYSKDNS